MVYEDVFVFVQELACGNFFELVRRRGGRDGDCEVAPIARFLPRCAGTVANTEFDWDTTDHDCILLLDFGAGFSGRAVMLIKPSMSWTWYSGSW